MIEEDLEKFGVPLEREPPIEKMIGGRRVHFFPGTRYQTAADPDRPNYSTFGMVFDMNQI